MRPGALDCLGAACAGGAGPAAHRGRDLVDRALARNLRLFRQVSPEAAAGLLRRVNERWPELLRGLRRDVTRARGSCWRGVGARSPEARPRLP